MANIKIEGQSIPVDDRIARDEKLLRYFLSTAFPQMANAEIKTDSKDDGLVVTVTKKAGHLGGPLERLLAAPTYFDPAWVLAYQLRFQYALGTLTLADMLLYQSHIQTVQTDWEACCQYDQTIKRRLLAARSEVAKYVVPFGF